MSEEFYPEHEIHTDPVENQPQQAQPVQVLAAAGRKTKQPPAGCSLQSPAVQLPLGRPLRQLAVTSGYGWR